MEKTQMSVRFKKYIYLFIAVVITAVIYSCNQEVSVTPPDKLPPDGYLFIGSNPEGAHIYLNGRDTRRVTPDSLTYLETGDYNFTLKKDLFRDTSFTFKVVEGEKKSAIIDYTKNPLMLGEIICKSSPSGAEVFLNDSSSGKVTPVTLKQIVPGNYKVRYHLKNYEDNLENIIVQSSKSSASSLTLIDTTTWQVFNTTNSPIRSNNISCVATDKYNNVWIGTEDEGLMKYNGTSWQTYLPVINDLPDIKVNVIAVEDDGTVWVGTKYGMLVITATGTERYNSFFNGSPFIDPFIRDVKTRPNGQVYIVTDSTFIIEFRTVAGYRAWNLQNEDYYGKYGHFSAFEVDNDNNYWIGTLGNGVFKYNNNAFGKDFYNTTTTVEIGDSVTAIAVSKTGNVWIGYKWSVLAQAGLSFYNGTSLRAPGIIPFNKNTNSIYIDDTNKKWIGTNAGLIVFDDLSNPTFYNHETTGLNIDDVRGVVKDQLGRVWIATYGGGLILKKK